MQVLSVHSLQILDVGQAVIHNQLTLGIVVASENETATALAMKEILILAHDIGLTVRFKPISRAQNTINGSAKVDELVISSRL